MTLIENVRQAFGALLLNKKRSVLTMIGIVIGISAVITIVSIGNTLTGIFENFISQMFGGNMIQVLSVSNDSSEVPNDHYFFNNDDYDKFMDNAPECIAGLLMQDIFYSGRFSVDNECFSNSRLMGVSEVYSLSKNLRIKEGRFITHDDCKKQKAVVVISDVTAENCFGTSENVIGKTIPFLSENGISTLLEMPAAPMYAELTVIGVYEYVDTQGTLKHVSDSRLFSSDSFCPYTYSTTFLETYIPDISEYSSPVLVVIAKSKHDLPAAEAYIAEFMHEREKEKFDGDEYYRTDSFSLMGDESMKQIEITVGIITGVFVLIAAISLLVGGIGLMNTMLVSVTERTKEIGIKKALGAKKSAIRVQFLTESAVLCLTACLIGIIFGAFIGMIIESNLDTFINKIPNPMFRYFLLNTEIHITPSTGAIVISTIFSLAVGLIFGYYPANKGAKMQPVDALRYE